MRRFSISRIIHQVMLPVTLVSFMSACHKWSTVREDPRAFIEQNDVHTVRLSLRSGDEIELVFPGVRGDTLVGWHNGEEFAIPTADVRELDKRTFDGLGTGFLIGSIVVVAGGLIVGAVALSEFDLW